MKNYFAIVARTTSSAVESRNIDGKCTHERRCGGEIVFSGHPDDVFQTRHRLYAGGDGGWREDGMTWGPS